MARDAAFFTDDARKRVTATIKEVEAQTSAEVVVAVRRRSGTYRQADYLFGFACAMTVLAVLLFAPQEFLVEMMPLDVLLAFGAGALVASRVQPLERALTLAKTRRAQVQLAARAAFVDLGITRTSGRNGLLVYVSAFERAVEVVTDIGFSADARTRLAPRFEALDAAARGGLDFARFVTALGALGAPLGELHPHRDDDVNELPDEVSAS
jgi:putative membrane protein